MGKSKVQKVGAGNTTDDKTSKDEKKEKGRVDFDVASAMYQNEKGEVVTAINEDGLLIAVPVPIKDADGKIVYAGFSTRKHLPLKKSVFAAISSHIRYQAYIARVKAAILIKGAQEKETKADRIEQYGDEATRRKVQKVARMREQLKVLEETLQEDGVDITKL